MSMFNTDPRPSAKLRRRRASRPYRRVRGEPLQERADEEVKGGKRGAGDEAVIAETQSNAPRTATTFEWNSGKRAAYLLVEVEPLNT